MNADFNELYELVIYQTVQFFPMLKKENIKKCIKDAVCDFNDDIARADIKKHYNEDLTGINPLNTVVWSVFLYKLSRRLYKNEYYDEADAMYYLNKIMNSVDWFYEVELPTHFWAEHPIGSILGRANYGDYLFVYQGTTVGTSARNGVYYYPTLGNNVVLFANATVLGDTIIGNNVVVSANTYIINEKIPDNCVVFGTSPKLIIKKKSRQDILGLIPGTWKN